MLLAFGATLNGNPNLAVMGGILVVIGGLWCCMLMLLWLSVVCLDSNPFSFPSRTEDDPRGKTGKHGTRHPRERSEETQVTRAVNF